MASLVGSVTGTTRGLRLKANELYGKASEELSLANEARAAGDSDSWATAIQRRSMYLTAANAKTRAATGTFFRSTFDRLPGVVKGALSTAGKVMEDNGMTLGKVSGAVLRRVPILGTLVTGVTSGTAIANGANPVKTIASGVGGMAASTVAGEAASAGMAAVATSSLAAGTTIGEAAGAMAGPVGIVVGAAVGAGVGYVVDHYGDDIAHGASEATHWVGHEASKLGHAIADLF